MADTPVMSQCFICKRPFKFGPHIYNGRRIAKWDMKSRLRKSAQADKWSFCLTAGTLCPANQERQ